MNARSGRSWSVGLAGLLAMGAVAPGCGDDGGEDDAGVVDAGPWTSGALTCGHDVMSEYATREYTFSDPFNRQELGRFWLTDAQASWTLQQEARIAVTGAGDGPGPLAMVADGQRGTDLVGWVEVERAGRWDSGPEILCRADGPPVTMGYGLRILGDHIEVFEQVGAAAAPAAPAAQSAALTRELGSGELVRAVIGCTGDTVTGFVFALQAEGGTAGEQLGCVSWRHEDEARAGAFALTQQGGSTAFDNVRLVVDP